MRTLALSLLILGYLALVPSCFLAPSAALHAHDDMSAMAMPQETGAACMNTLFLHQGMFLSMTGIAESVAFTLALFVLLMFVFVGILFLARPAPLHVLSYRREPLSSFLATRRSIAWLSLKEASPHIV